MKKGMMAMFFIVAVILFGVVFFVVKNKNVYRIEVAFTEDITSNVGEMVKVTFEVQDETEAKEIADKMGIEYVRCTRGVAIYQTEKNIEEIYSLAEENGYTKPKISYQEELVQ